MKLKRGDIKMKIEEQVLSREQMKHLQELGVDTSDASMCWVAGEDTSTDEEEWNLIIPNNFLMPYNIPTYTIGDLIEKLPIEIGTLNRGIVIQRSYVGAGYIKDNLSPVSFSNSSLLESLYNLLCWLAENHKEILDVKK